jgi:hypothetical protein
MHKMLYMTRNVHAANFVKNMRFDAMAFGTGAGDELTMTDNAATHIANTATNYNVIKTSDGTIDVG